MNLPFFDQLSGSRNILIAGAGGGFDVFAGLPLFAFFRAAGKTVHLANLSFSDLSFCDGDRPAPSLLRVMPDSSGPGNYFPELYLAQWLANRGQPTPVYAIERTGARPVLAAYEWLTQELQPDALVLIDGGTDSLMRGDEAGLGTPQEDMASLFAASAVSGVDKKFLVTIGFGVDVFHGICHANFLENVAELIQEGGYLGAWPLLNDLPEFKFFKDALDFVSARMPRQPSIVNTSIVSAVEGKFGDHHATRRTEGSTLLINPLMAFYWAFRIDHVARRNLYLDRIRETDTYVELTLAIEAFRAKLPKTRPWTVIPC